MDDKTLLSVIEKFGAGQLAELELNDGALRLVLRKESALLHRGAAPTATSAAHSAHPAQAAGATGSAGQADHAVRLGLPAHAAAAASGGEAITSPIVATFYRSPGPDTPSFVEPGSKVKAGDTLCILEAMKMMNHLEAEFDCEILAVNAKNGELVEYGQALFEVVRL